VKRIYLAAILIAGLLPPASGGTPEYRPKASDAERLSPEMREAFAGLQYLLNAHQIRQFLDLPGDEERVRWLERFWRLSDPTPTTPQNEMRTEHLVRVGLARQFFPSKRWPGWDKRGEVFIRYGVPDFRGKIWGEVTVRGLHPPGELWYYRRHDMLVSFERSGRGDEYIYAVNALGDADKISPDLAEYLLYDTREGLAKKIPQDLLEFYLSSAPDETFRRFGEPEREGAYLQSKPRELPENIDAIMDPNLPYELPRDISAAFQKEKIRKVADNFEITLEDTPSSYPFNFDRRELPFYFAVDQFRGGESTNRVEVQIEIPVSVEKGDTLEETYRAEVVLWDAKLDEAARMEREIVLHAAPGSAEWANLLPTQMAFPLSRGYYRMAVSVRGENSGRESVYRTSFSSEAFGPGLALSDILFARKIAQAGSPSIFTRGPIEVIPHPYRAYSRSFALPLYFEIYNLKLDGRGVSSYRIQYRIVPQAKEKRNILDRLRETAPVVASEFESSGYGEHETQYIFVRTENLAKGPYEVLVTVTDNQTGEMTYRRGTFSIVD
jgi:GWxTD domain-containing protein